MEDYVRPHHILHPICKVILSLAVIPSLALKNRPGASSHYPAKFELNEKKIITPKATDTQFLDKETQYDYMVMKSY